MAETLPAPSPHQRTLPSLPTALRHAWNLAPMILVHVGAVAILWTGGT